MQQQQHVSSRGYNGAQCAIHPHDYKPQSSSNQQLTVGIAMNVLPGAIASGYASTL
jgi:hypothetical protein